MKNPLTPTTLLATPARRRTNLGHAVALAVALMLTTAVADTAAAAAPADVESALRALPRAEVVHAAADGVPFFVRGDLGRAPKLDARNLPAAELAMRDLLAPVLATMRLQAVDLRLRKVNDGVRGNQHLRYNQTHRGLDVVGADLVVHVDGQGRIVAINGTARGDIPATLGSRKISESSAKAAILRDARYIGMAVAAPRTVFLLSPDGVFAMAYESVVTGSRMQLPVRDKVYVDVGSGAVLAAHPQIHFALDRQVSSASSAAALPGTLQRTEGGGASADVDVNAAYDSLGVTWQAYKSFWNRDSFDNAGAPLLATVQTNSSNCNAYWDGQRSVFNVGKATVGCLPLVRSPEIVAHELTHAVTAHESGLINTGESGALNESISDIFGAFTEAFIDGRLTGYLAVTSDTWKIGEDVLSAKQLRRMDDPVGPLGTGTALDFYDADAIRSADVHDAAGIANLAFYLMSQGGSHPQGRSDLLLRGIGMQKAVRVFYDANVNVLTSNAGFLAAAHATVQAAINLGYTAGEQRAVAAAWQAVGVPVLGPIVHPVMQLLNDVPISRIGGAAGSTRMFMFDLPAGASLAKFDTGGGTGNMNMYVKFGSPPSLGFYDCQSKFDDTLANPSASRTMANIESCNLKTPRAGRYYVMLHGATAYSNVTLVGLQRYPDPVLLTNGETVTISGKAATTKVFAITVPAYKQLTTTVQYGNAWLKMGLYTDMSMKTRWLPTAPPPPCTVLTGNCAQRPPAKATVAYLLIEAQSDYTDVPVTLKY